jgi:hypothetical protein
MVGARAQRRRAKRAEPRAPRAPGHADRAERDVAEAKEREPQADRAAGVVAWKIVAGSARERARRPAARPERQRLASLTRRLRRARQPAGRSNGPGLNRRAPTWRRATKWSGGTTVTAGSMPDAFRAHRGARRPSARPVRTIPDRSDVLGAKGGSRASVSFAGARRAAWIL